MLDFKNIEITDKPWVDELLKYSQFKGTEYCFTSLFIWANFYNSLISRYNDILIVRSLSETGADYLYPAGKFSDIELKTILKLISEDAVNLGKSANIIGITNEGISRLENLFPQKFSFIPVRSSYDYIYCVKNLISLTGKKYQPKRNFINHFLSNENWKYEDISLENITECTEMNNKWCEENYCIHNISKQSESCATRKALKNFFQLNLKGGLLRVDNEVIAFSIGEPLNNDTFIVHVEKAFSRIKGAYPMINREFLFHEASAFKYVNREDDAGDEGLRKAKLAYNPEYLVEKYNAILK
ncbi:MAG: phosphatidylglycerol lysyltransferase domain-containing protein [Bacteroidales bacterium]|jgi:hypothetical protein